MRNFNIRNIDDELLSWIRKRAAEHGHSMNTELLEMLNVFRTDEWAANHRDNPVAKSWLRARDRGIQTPSDSVEILRADRDRDDRRRR